MPRKKQTDIKRIKHNRKLLNSGGLKPDRVPLFQTLLDLIEKHRRVNQYE